MKKALSFHERALFRHFPEKYHEPFREIFKQNLRVHDSFEKAIHISIFDVASGHITDFDLVPEFWDIGESERIRQMSKHGLLMLKEYELVQNYARALMNYNQHEDIKIMLFNAGGTDADLSD